MKDPPVDFAGLARAFGLAAWGPVEDPRDLQPVLAQAVQHVLRQHAPALVDVVMQNR
jgi:thiamine pyrophosphate-dependent acetolactate synthase large subunit-like protein